MPEAGRGTTSHGLRRSLENSDHAWLIEMIDWRAQPQRSAAKLAWLVIAATLACPVIIFGTLYALVFALQGVPIPYPNSEIYGERMSVAFLISAFLPVFLAGLLAAFVQGRFVAASRREVSKFPELALFGKKAPTL